MEPVFPNDDEVSQGVGDTWWGLGPWFEPWGSSERVDGQTFVMNNAHALSAQESLSSEDDEEGEETPHAQAAETPSRDWNSFVNTKEGFLDHSGVDKENHAPREFAIMNNEGITRQRPTNSSQVLARILHGIDLVQERVDAIERRLGHEISTMRTLLSKFVDYGHERDMLQEAPSSVHRLITPAMQQAIDNVKPLKYWGECLHFVLKRPELFENIIHWDEKSSNYWISSEAGLYAILAELKGSTPQRARESMKSRFFIRLINEDSRRACIIPALGQVAGQAPTRGRTALPTTKRSWKTLPG